MIFKFNDLIYDVPEGAEHDLERDEHRLYKLTIDDVIYFDL